MLINQNEATRIRTPYILKILSLYRVLHERSNNTAYFTEHFKFQEKLTFADVL